MIHSNAEEVVVDNRNRFISFFVNILTHIDRKLYVRAELKRIRVLKIENILSDSTAKKLLESYLQAGSLFVSETMILFKCYYICDRLLKNSFLLDNVEIEHELYEFCPHLDWKKKLREEFEKYKETRVV